MIYEWNMYVNYICFELFWYVWRIVNNFWRKLQPVSLPWPPFPLESAVENLSTERIFGQLLRCTASNGWVSTQHPPWSTEWARLGFPIEIGHQLKKWAGDQNKHHLSTSNLAAWNVETCWNHSTTHPTKSNLFQSFSFTFYKPWEALETFVISPGPPLAWL